MKVVILHLFLLVGITQACNSTECIDLYPAADFMEHDFLPNREQLLNLCPKTLQFFDCTNRYISTCEKDIRELALLDDLLTERMTLSYVTLEKLAREICDENSTLHKGYVDSIDCFRDFLSTVNSVCAEESLPVEAKILEILRFVKDEDELYPSAACLKSAFEMGCFTVQLEKTCGETARTTAVSVLQTLKPLMGNEGCLQLENGGAELKAKLLEALDLEESQKIKFQIAFDLVRRKR